MYSYGGYNVQAGLTCVLMILKTFKLTYLCSHNIESFHNVGLSIRMGYSINSVQNVCFSTITVQVEYHPRISTEPKQ